MNNNLEDIKIRFDNAGGIQLLSTTYAHDYYGNFPYSTQAARDVRAIIAGADLGGWDGNEQDVLEAHLAGESFPDDRVYSIADLLALLDGGKIALDESGGVEIDGKHLSGHAEAEFFRALLATEIED